MTLDRKRSNFQKYLFLWCHESGDRPTSVSQGDTACFMVKDNFSRRGVCPGMGRKRDAAEIHLGWRPDRGIWLVPEGVLARLETYWLLNPSAFCFFKSVLLKVLHILLPASLCPLKKCNWVISALFFLLKQCCSYCQIGTYCISYMYQPQSF